VYDQDGETMGDVTGYGSGSVETEDPAGDVEVRVYDSLGRVVEDVTGSGTVAAGPVATYYDADSEVTGTGSATEPAARVYDGLHPVPGIGGVFPGHGRPGGTGSAGRLERSE
jgi:hypothetical protein